MDCRAVRSAAAAIHAKTLIRGLWPATELVIPPHRHRPTASAETHCGSRVTARFEAGFERASHRSTFQKRSRRGTAVKVLVAGATGYLGRHVAPDLKARGHAVRALVRDPDRLGPLRDTVDEVITADATDVHALDGCCDGVDVLVSTVGLVGRPARLSCWDVDYGANLNLLREAQRARVHKFVYVSVVHAPALEDLALVRAKRAFENELRASGMGHTILYPNGYFSDMEDYLRMARRGRAFVFGKGGFREGGAGKGGFSINPIAGEDVAAALADAVSTDERSIELGGPEVLTHEQIARAAFEALGRRARITHLPPSALKFGLMLLRRFTPVRIHAVLEFPLTVLTHDVIAPTKGRRRLADHFRAEAEARP
jgi:uncharacterized protein YbjT (DUF2867 family)